MMIEDPDFLNKIRTGIERNGVYLIATSILVDDEEEIDPNQKSECTELDDAFVYSVGHREHGRPDLLLLCGPCSGEIAINKEETEKRLEAAASLLVSLVSQWDDEPVLPDEACMDRNDRVYTVRDSSIDKASDWEIKHHLTTQTTEYYGDVEYDLLLLIPNKLH
jgi:hypothetical protein